MMAKPSILLSFLFVPAICCAALLGSAGCGGPQGAQDRDRSQTRLELAKDFLRKGQLQAAETEAQKAVSLNERNEEAHYVLGLIDLMHANAAHRTTEIEECLTGIDAEVQDTEAQTRLRDAETHLARASSLAPDFGEAWANRGIVATLLDNYGAAIEHFQRALAHPNRLENVAFVHAALGWAYFLQGDLVAATRDLLQASQLQPGMCLSTYRLGRVYFARKEWEKALGKFREVADKPQCPIQDAYLYLMKTQVELGSTEGLSELGQSCVALAPRSCIAAQCRDLAPDAAGDAGSQPPASIETTNTNQGP
jgi:tetratricopeptide (TPR) repeat protein